MHRLIHCEGVFFFYCWQEDVCEAIYAALETCCPALYLERAPLSVASIRAPSGGVETIRAYQPRDIVLAQLAGFDAVRLDNNNTVSEKLVDIIAFGDSEVFSYLQPGINQVVGTLPLYARYCLASLLDGVKGGGDWLKLAAALQLPIDPSIQGKGLDNVVYSPTDGSLGEWTRMTRGQATIRDLVDKLKGIDRFDVVDMLLNLTPLYRFVPKNDETVQLTW